MKNGGGGVPQEFCFASLNNKITYRFLCASIIYNKVPIILPHSYKITNINIIDNLNTIRYLIYDGINWYTFKNNRWEIIYQPDSINILSKGMTSSEIRNLSKNNYANLYNNKNKFINFCACLTKDQYDDKINIQKVTLTYSKIIHKKTKDFNYDIIDYYDEINIIWKTVNKQQIILLME